MTATDSVLQIAALLREAGSAHHKAFAATNGDDPEWPHWYADYLLPRFSRLLPAPLTVEQLAALLKRLEDDRAQHDPHAEWAAYYATRLAASRHGFGFELKGFPHNFALRAPSHRASRIFNSSSPVSSFRLTGAPFLKEYNTVMSFTE